MALHDFKRENGKIIATNYPTWIGRKLGYKPKEYVFVPKGTYMMCGGNSVYYDQYGNEWNNGRIMIFDNTNINFPYIK